jgi:hypothetical protein
MNFYIVALMGITSFSFLLNCMDSVPTIVYRQANQEDVAKILTLIESREQIDNKKIVVLPQKFIEGALRSSLQKNRIFVAQTADNHNIIGYKKMFVITDVQEKKDIFENEIRAEGTQKEQINAGIFVAGKFVPNSELNDDFSNGIYIYNGGDLTHPDYRGKGNNKNLTDYAFKKLMPTVQSMLQQKQWVLPSKF